MSCGDKCVQFSGMFVVEIAPMDGGSSFLLQTVSVSTFRYVVELRYRATMFGLNKRPDMSVLILLLNEFALNSTSAAVSDTFTIQIIFMSALQHAAHERVIIEIFLNFCSSFEQCESALIARWKKRLGCRTSSYCLFKPL